MAIIIGSGEPVSRVRRGLDVKGRINLALDETLVGIVNVADFTGPPYRRSPVRWWSHSVLTGVPGAFSTVRLANVSGRDQLLDRIMVRVETDTNVLVGSGLGQAPGAGTPARTTELVRVPANATGDISREIPIEAQAIAITPSSIFDVLLQHSVEAVQGADFPVEIVLPAAPRPELPAANVTTLTIETSSLDVNLRVTFSGLYFDTLPLDTRT